MKKIIITCFLLLINIGFSQSTNFFTSFDNGQSVNVQNRISTITLFEIDFEGQKFPITVKYNHAGLKVNEYGSSLGLGWELCPLGKINTTINDEADAKPTTGWFNSLNPSNVVYGFYSTVQTAQYQNGLHGENGVDMSPDYFSLSTSNGLNFNFLYKKNLSGNTVLTPSPVIFSGNNGFKINTIFSNFYINQQISNSNKVFTVIDDKGINYDFINGPNLTDVNRSSYSNRNDFYLSNVKSNNSSDFINIDYYTSDKEHRDYYSVGFTDEAIKGNANKVRNLNGDYSFTDISKNEIKKITTKNNIIEFVYNDINLLLLEEINVYDLTNNFITGYKFEYNDIVGGFVEGGGNLNFSMLWRISKFNQSKSETLPLYQFEYFDGQDIFNNDTRNSDVYGYYNGATNNQTPFPFITFYTGSTIQIPAANRIPDLNFLKWHALKKITNIFGGTKEFDYKLNYEVFSPNESAYAGGMLISSIIEQPLIGKSILKTYDYSMLKGYVVSLNSLKQHFSLQYLNRFFYSSQIKPLDIIYYQEDLNINTDRNVISGNFFKFVIENGFDNNTMDHKYQIISEYERADNGLAIQPILKKRHHYSPQNLTKIEEFTYNEFLQTTFPMYRFRKESRTYGSSGGYSKYETKSLRNFQSFSKKLVSVKTNEYINYPISNDNFETIKNYTYINNNNNFLKSVSETNSLGEIRETKFYYPGDTEVSTEPNISNLININKIGLPLLKRDYLNSNLLFEDKTQFGSFPSTTAAPYFLPQYSLSKKNIHSFEQRAGFKYDNKGNVIELTKDNGVNTVYIWGYNSSKLIAQIDNVNYATIQSLIPNLQTISNTGTESQLLTALATFRGDSNLANSFVTTYTYTTSLNISTITDPNGKKNTYTYDDYNRLQFIKDNNGKIVLENETKYQFEN